MFIIPCKYNSKYPFIIDLVKDIRKFHPTEKIMVVDSASEDKSYFKTLEQNDVIIEDINNRNWMIGAYWHGFKKYPNEDYYYFMHDSMRVKASLDYLKKEDLTIWLTFNRNADPSFNKLNDYIKEKMSYPKELITPIGFGVSGIIFFCKNKVITNMYNNGVSQFLPSTKQEVGWCDGAYGLFLEIQGYDLNKCSLFGDILIDYSPHGKYGAFSNDNTNWQFPIQKFCGSHIDEMRNHT